MSKELLIILLTLFSLRAKAQQTAASSRVSLTVVGEANMPLEGATAELRRAKDSVLVKTSLTDKSGVAEFEQVRAGDFFIKVSMVNFTSLNTSKFAVDAQPVILPAVQLKPKPATQLQEVTVTAKKPFIQKLQDRIVVNVENSIVSAGSSAIDVLERSPGINIDQNDIISLRGRTGVTIYIDGKRTALTGADLANYLRGLPSSAIERIDIITNPSSKYDAAGNSGIIDIRFKKDQRLGVNGTVTAAYGQGIYPKANAGTTFNYRNKKLNVFGNYNYAYRLNLNHLILDRSFFTNGVFTGQDKKDNYAKMPVNSHTARIGQGRRMKISILICIK